MDLCSLEIPESTAAPISVPAQVSPAVTKQAKKSSAAGKSPLTLKKPATGGGKIKLTVPFASFSSSESTSSSQSRLLRLFVLKGRAATQAGSSQDLSP